MGRVCSLSSPRDRVSGRSNGAATEFAGAPARGRELQEEKPAHDHREVEDDAERARGEQSKGTGRQYQDGIHATRERDVRREPLDPVLADEAIAFDQELRRRLDVDAELTQSGRLILTDTGAMKAPEIGAARKPRRPDRLSSIAIALGALLVLAGVGWWAYNHFFGKKG